MTSSQAVERIKQRCHYNNDLTIIGELKSALSWAYARLFNSEKGPDQLMSFDTELAISSQTRDYDLGANISGTLAGIKTLWLKLASDTNFTPMLPRDALDQSFLWDDQFPASDTTTVATAHPVRFDVVNFAKVRFAPPLPSGCTVRADVWLYPPDIDPASNNSLTYGSDIPPVLHESIVDKATAQVFSIMDDTRAQEWEIRAERRLNDDLHLIRGRAQGPVQTQPYRRMRRRLA